MRPRPLSSLRERRGYDALGHTDFPLSLSSLSLSLSLFHGNCRFLSLSLSLSLSVPRSLCSSFSVCFLNWSEPILTRKKNQTHLIFFPMLQGRTLRVTLSNSKSVDSIHCGCSYLARRRCPFFCLVNVSSPFPPVFDPDLTYPFSASIVDLVTSFARQSRHPLLIVVPLSLTGGTKRGTRQLHFLLFPVPGQSCSTWKIFS